jgi:hypothetical protein
MGKESPTIFSDRVPHSAYGDFHTISAGFVTFTIDKSGLVVPRCYGKSKSLEKKSRPKKDENCILQCMIEGFDVKGK